MIDGFICVGKTYFYCDLWPRIHAEVDAVKTNLKTIKQCRKDGIPEPELVVYWGYKVEASEEYTVLAITQSNMDDPDRYWVAPHLI